MQPGGLTPTHTPTHTTHTTHKGEAVAGARRHGAAVGHNGAMAPGTTTKPPADEPRTIGDGPTPAEGPEGEGARKTPSPTDQL